MRGKFLLFLVLLIFVFSSLAWAESSVLLTAVKNEISPSEGAVFDLKITNQNSLTQRYSIFSLRSGIGWAVDPSPLKDRIVELRPGASYTTQIVARPLEDFPPGIYTMSISIESDLGESYTRNLKVYLRDDKPLDYLPSIKAELDMDEKITPGEPLSIKLFLDNRNPLDLKDLVVRIESEIPEFRKEVHIDLPPLERKTVEFSITTSKFQQPKDYYLFFVFEKEGQTVKVINQKVEVVSLLPKFNLKISEDSTFFKTTTVVDINNDGNVLNTQEVAIPVSFWKALFSSDVNTKKIDGVRSLVWEVALAPDETTQVMYVTNYRILFYILLVIFIFFAFYQYVKSAIVLNKAAVTTKSSDEALSEIKVKLEVRNRSRYHLNSVAIVDYIPGIANIKKSLEIGTVKPKEIKNTRKGTKVIWSLAELEPQEHRIITYKIKAKLNIVGTFSLPRATASYKKGNKPGKAYSNTFRLGN